MRILWLLIVCLALVSCEKALIDDNPSADARANFESLWQTVHDKYSYFELKGINWDSVYTHYSPRVNNQTGEKELFNILDSMLYDLRDGHVNLVSPFNLSRNWQWYLGYPDNFNHDVIERNYLGDDYKIAGGMEYTIIDSVGYIYYGSFGSSFTTQNLNAVMQYMKGTKGLIVDVRHNGGGSLGLAFSLAERLVDRQKQVIVSFEKTGPGPDDFGKSLSYSVSPSEEVNYNGPVTVLTNRRSYSATNSFAAIVSQFDKITLIGDQTGGGGGLPVDFELPIGWRYRFSATRSLIPSGNEYFDIELGIPPDIKASTDLQRMNQGIDDILETALDQYR